MKILVASSVFPSALAELRRDHDVVVAVDAPRERLLELIEDREALVFRSGVTISAEVMSRAPDLRLLIRAGSGLDNLDLEYATRNRIELVRVPEPGARAVAELAFGFMLALARQMLFADLELRAGHWAKHRITGHLLADKTLGIYGAGNIGSLVGAMGAAWGMKVIGCVDRASPSRAAELASSNIRLATCEEVLTESDFVSIHLPLDASTRGLFDAERLARTKPGAFLINLARGGVVIDQALFDALHSGHLAGAGVDVHELEGEGEISPLATLPNVILTPHMGAGTIDSQRRIGERVIAIVTEHDRECKSGHI